MMIANMMVHILIFLIYKNMYECNMKNICGYKNCNHYKPHKKDKHCKLTKCRNFSKFVDLNKANDLEKFLSINNEVYCINTRKEKLIKINDTKNFN